MSDDETPDALADVARDLREIEALVADLPAEAETKGTTSEAMVMLGPVANLEAWQNIIDARDEAAREAEERGLNVQRYDTSHVEDHDPDWEPPLQTLEFWSEQWRVVHGMELDTRPTEASEAAFLRRVLTWAYDHEPRWDDFTADVHKARIRLENTLRAGEQVERGAPCLYEECGGPRLIRRLVREGRKWRHTDWYCPRKPDKHTWDEDAYARMVTAAHEATKREQINGEAWTSIDVAAREVGRSYRTVQTWVNEWRVRVVCVVRGRRRKFVSLEDVRAEDAKAARRRRGRAA